MEGPQGKYSPAKSSSAVKLAVFTGSIQSVVAGTVQQFRLHQYLRVRKLQPCRSLNVKVAHIPRCSLRMRLACSTPGLKQVCDYMDIHVLKTMGINTSKIPPRLV